MRTFKRQLQQGHLGALQWELLRGKEIGILNKEGQKNLMKNRRTDRTVWVTEYQISFLRHIISHCEKQQNVACFLAIFVDILTVYAPLDLPFLECFFFFCRCVLNVTFQAITPPPPPPPPTAPPPPSLLPTPVVQWPYYIQWQFEGLNKS